MSCAYAGVFRGENMIKHILAFIKRSSSLFILVLFMVMFFNGHLPEALRYGAFFVLMLSILMDIRNFGLFNQILDSNRKLQYIDELTSAMRQSIKLNEVLELVMKNLTTELGYDRVLIFSFEHRGYRKDVLAPVAGLNIPMEKLENFFFKYDKGEDIVPKSAIEKKPYIVRNAREDHRCSQSFVELLDLTEYIVIPMISKNVIVGVLLADNRTNGRKILEDDLMPLIMFSNQGAMAIENARLYEKIEALAVTDGLTQVYNHRYFQDSLKAELNRLERYYKESTEKVSLMILDIDNFKKYNDAFGHQSGDTVLTEIGLILKGLSRKVDVVARYGGEEFVVMMPATPKEGAAIFAERVRSGIENYKFEMRDGQVQSVTVSIGVSTYSEDAKTPQALIEKADKNLYLAKSEGKNRVVLG